MRDRVPSIEFASDDGGQSHTCGGNAGDENNWERPMLAYTGDEPSVLTTRAGARKHYASTPELRGTVLPSSSRTVLVVLLARDIGM